MKINKFAISLFCILLLVISVSGATRAESVIKFVDSTRNSDSGFANTPSDQINLKSTTQAMQVKTILGSEINNSLDILYYLQTLQNSSGGFSMSETDETSLEATFYALEALQYLDVNQSQFIQWEIFPYINETSQNELVEIINSTLTIKPLNYERLTLWFDFILASSRLGVVPSFPFLELINQVKSLQYSNGSYFDFHLAVGSVKLLSILGEEPNDLDLAKKYILSYTGSNGAFAETHNGQTTLKATYLALHALNMIISLETFELRTEITRFVFNQQQASSGFAEGESETVTIESTFHGVEILFLLQNVGELNAPDVLQELGFVNYQLLYGMAGMIWIVFMIRRNRN